MYTMFVPTSSTDQEIVGSPGTGVKNSCEPTRGSWELNSSPPNEQVHLTTDPSLQPPTLVNAHKRSVLYEVPVTSHYTAMPL